MRCASFLVKRLLAIVLPLAGLTQTYAQEPGADELNHGNARIVLVGDSITGLSRNAGSGFAHQMDWALKQVFPDCKPNLIALGGSGQGVGSWVGVEKTSRTEERFLDVKGIPVKATLDQHADVLVIMLGMNDVLAPYVVDEPESLQKWTDSYRDLIKALQTRLTPKVTALATPTLCAEDVHSPKNLMMGKLIERVQALAKEMNLLVLPTNATMQEVLRQGRKVKRDFHVTYDFIHPNEAGHLAIAMGMLRGLGVPEAARRLEEERLKPLLQKKESPKLVGEDVLSLDLPWHYRGHDDRPDRTFRRIEDEILSWVFDVPRDWPFIQENFTDVDPDNEFGLPQGFRRVRNSYAERQVVSRFAQTYQFPTMWHVAHGLMHQKAWKEGRTFDPALVRGPVEEAIEKDRIWAGPADLSDGRKLEWAFYSPTIDYTGGDVPGCVNFDAVAHARPFEGGVAYRRIRSTHDCPVHIDLGTKALSPSLYLTVYLNGHVLYSGLITAEPGKHKTLSAVLRPGWNTLAFTLDHTSWQMQCSVDLHPLGGRQIDDFFYVTDDEVDFAFFKWLMIEGGL